MLDMVSTQSQRDMYFMLRDCKGLGGIALTDRQQTWCEKRHTQLTLRAIRPLFAGYNAWLR